MDAPATATGAEAVSDYPEEFDQDPHPWSEELWERLERSGVDEEEINRLIEAFEIALFACIAAEEDANADAHWKALQEEPKP